MNVIKDFLKRNKEKLRAFRYASHSYTAAKILTTQSFKPLLGGLTILIAFYGSNLWRKANEKMKIGSHLSDDELISIYEVRVKYQ